MSKIYTQNWFDRCIPDWENWLIDFKNKPNLKFLEVGSYEGRSTCWLLDNILTDKTSTITCIDLFDGCSARGEWSKELYDRYNMSQVLQNFIKNTSEYGSQVKIFIGSSDVILRNIPLKSIYNFIYIDGSHIASDVLIDTILAFPLLNEGGIMVLDDYAWEFFDNPLRHPKIAIDSFLEIFANQIEIIDKDRQVAIRKIGRKEGFDD